MKSFLIKTLTIVAISLLGILIYSNTFHSPFQFDDELHIVKNLSIRSLSDTKAIWNEFPSRFVTNLTLAVNYHFGKLDVFGYHLFNIAVHLLSALAVWWLMLLTLATPTMKNTKMAGHSRLMALFAGLVFIAHPIQTQAVTYIIQRTTSLAALFYILSVCFYAKSRLSENRAMVWRYYTLSLLSALLAMFTKEFTATLPMVIILYELFFLKSEEKVRWVGLIPFLVMVCVIPVAMLSAHPLSYIKEGTTGPSGISSLDYLFTQFRVVVTYLRLLVLPIHQNLDYDYAVSRSLFEIPVLLSLSFLLMLVTAGVFLYKRHRLLSFAIFWFFITLSVESSFIPLQDVIYEHRLYLPLVGFSMFLAGVIYDIFGSRGIKPVIAILTVMVVFYSILTYNRNIVWKDELALWNDAIQKSPGKARPYSNRGFVYQSRGQLDQAIADHSRALEIKPNLCEAYNNRAYAYQLKGEIDRAIADYSRAIELKSDYYEAYNNRGNAYQSKGDLDRAIADFNKALTINEPNLFEVYNNRGNAYRAKGDLAQAISDFDHAIEIHPTCADAYYNRGLAYKTKGNLDQAIADFNRALAIAPDLFKAYNNRGNVYRSKGDLGQAISDYNKALAIAPAFFEAYNNRGNAYKIRGELDQAIADYDQTLQINPNCAVAYANRASVYFLKKDYKKAWRDVRRAEALGLNIDPAFLASLRKTSGEGSFE